jgi:CubicO group peptidase (beta-lactamase class C family)
MRSRLRHGIRIILLCVFTVASCHRAAAQVDGLDALAGELAAGRHGDYTSLLVHHRGSIVAERYFRGTDRATRHDIRSATKSITSLAVGIAVDRKLLAGPDERVFDRLSELSALAQDRDPQLRLQDLLTMRSGLACDDWVPASLGHEDRMYEAPDWLRFWGSLPRSHDRSQHYSYCTGNVVAAASMAERASSMRFDRFVQAHLFEPIGIRGAVWARAPNGAIDAGGHLKLTARDLLAVGRLILSQGKVGLKRVVSAEWVKESTAIQTAVYERRQKYGYLWWIDDLNIGKTQQTARVIYAWGNGGTYLFVVPEHDLVVVFTGRNFNSRIGLLPQTWMRDYILPAFNDQRGEAARSGLMSRLGPTR